MLFALQLHNLLVSVKLSYISIEILRLVAENQREEQEFQVIVGNCPDQPAMYPHQLIRRSKTS